MHILEYLNNLYIFREGYLFVEDAIKILAILEYVSHKDTPLFYFNGDIVRIDIINARYPDKVLRSIELPTKVFVLWLYLLPQRRAMRKPSNNHLAWKPSVEHVSYSEVALANKISKEVTPCIGNING